jgi:hypothetical protein
VARAEGRLLAHAGGQGQDAARRQHPPGAQQHRAVVQGRVDVENGQQQVAREAGVQGHAAFGQVAQGHVLFDDHQRADVPLGHVQHGGDELLEGLVLHAGPLAPQPPRPHLGQGVADVALEKNDDHQEDGPQEVGQQPVEGQQAEDLGEVVDQDHQHEPPQHRQRPGARMSRISR